MIFCFWTFSKVFIRSCCKNTWISPNMTIESSPLSLWILHLLLLEILIPELLDFCTQSVIYYMSYKPSVTEYFSLYLKSDRLIHSNWHRDQHILHPYSINLFFNCLNISKAILSSQNVSATAKIVDCHHHWCQEFIQSSLLPDLENQIPLKILKVPKCLIGTVTVLSHSPWDIILSCLKMCIFFNGSANASLFRCGWKSVMIYWFMHN